MPSDNGLNIQPLNFTANVLSVNVETSHMEQKLMETKKKKRNEHDYAQTIRKNKRNSGEEYITKNSKIVRAKVFENKCCLCSKKCLNNLTYEERKSNFEEFWKLKDFKIQNLFLCGAVHKRIIKQRRPRTFERQMRRYSLVYFLSTYNSVQVPVCKRFFLDTFQISAGRLTRALNADTPGTDNRGKMPGSSRKTEENEINIIKDHILSFPAYESDYTRADHTPGRKYLSPDLNIRKMYGLYMEKCRENNVTCVSETVYRKVFNSEFNLNFHSHRKDSCQHLNLLKLNIEVSTNEDEKLDLTQNHDLH